MTYTANSQLATLTDANGNVTTYEYDGLDRLRRIRFPNASGGGSSSTDYEQFAYNDNSLVTQQRLRDGGEINFTYDNLSRVTAIDAPSGTPDIANAYDNFSRLTQTAFTGTHTLSFAYDQLSRNTSAMRVADGATQVVSYQYDLAGWRTRVTWPDSFYAQYDYDLTGAVTAIRENGASSGVGVLASYAYDNLGRRTGVTRGNGVTTAYSYDAASRLSQLSQNLAGASGDLTLGFSYNAAGQAVSRTGMTGAYAWPQPSINAEMYTANGRNQYTNVGGANFTYDSRGNLTATGSATYGYDAFNRLTSAGSASLSYDPAGRLYQVSASPNTTRFLYDGLDAIAEYNGSNVLQRRYVHGPSFDEPVVWYEGSGTTDRRWLVADQLGSVVAATDADGDLIGSPNTYDEYGRPGAGNTGRFQYTGQMWLTEAGIYHYKARAYNPAIGAFLQTDPILYAGGMNLYMCAAADPVNNVDPLGLDDEEAELVINGVRWRSFATVGDLFAAHGSSASPYTPLSHGETVEEIVVTRERDINKQSRRGREPCISSSAGPVFYYGGGLDMVLVLGVGISVYRFHIPSIGAEGWVSSGSALGGLGGSLGVTTGAVDTFGNFIGGGWRIDVETLAFPGLGGTFVMSDQGVLAGGGGNYAAGGGVYGGRTQTTLLQSNIPVCP
ncbi:MAG: RHS repeat-associated core domain-containing protein [Hyphomonadaceae bacterium]